MSASPLMPRSPSLNDRHASTSTSPGTINHTDLLMSRPPPGHRPDPGTPGAMGFQGLSQQTDLGSPRSLFGHQSDLGIPRVTELQGIAGLAHPGSPRSLSSRLRMGQGPPLPPIGTSAGGSGAVSGGGTGGGVTVTQPTEPISGDLMDAIREQNRRLAASQGLSGSRRRPVSANKKFLAKYHLEKFNVFGPNS